MQARPASSLVYALRDCPWQAFGTFTFKNPLPVNRGAEVLVRNTMRKACRMAHVHFESAWFLTRGELGELNGRFHYHMLIGNFPPFAGTSGFCLDLKSYWSRLRLNVGSLAGVQGDICQVWPYDSTLDGVRYVMKGVERYEFAAEARAYELTKFGLTDRVTLSTGLLLHVSRQIRKEAAVIAVNREKAGQRPVTVKTLKQGEHYGPGGRMAEPSQRSSCRTLSQIWVTQ